MTEAKIFEVELPCGHYATTEVPYNSAGGPDEWRRVKALPCEDCRVERTRSARFEFRLTPREWDTLTRRASAAALSVTEYVRKRCCYDREEEAAMTR